MNIIPTPLNKVDLSDSISKTAAQYLQNKLRPIDMVGQGCGRAVSRTIEYLTIEPISHISVVTLTGGVHYYLHNRRKKKRAVWKSFRIYM